MLGVTIDNGLIRIGARFAVSFQRTLRIPDDGRTYPLPPGLGRFPIFPVKDYLDSLPPEWDHPGGAFIPLYQREALWLGFHAAAWNPNAVQISVGMINAVSGEPANPVLHCDPQDYLVCPEQPWLDGIHTREGSVRQFVAMPLGLGYTIESALTGAETFGGIQITVFEPKPGQFPDQPPLSSTVGPMRAALPKSNQGSSMGLGAGGAIKQKIYPDPYGIGTWDQENYGQIFIHIINSAQFFEITGLEPLPTPIDAQTYTDYGLPWFDLFDEAKSDILPSDRLAQVKTLADQDAQKGASLTDPSVTVSESQIEKLSPHHSVRAEDWPTSSESSEQPISEK